MRNLLKHLWFLALAIFVFSCASSPDAPVEASPELEVTESVDETKEPVWVTIEVDEYFIAQETIKYEDGFIDGYRLYEYDDQGRILKKSQVASDQSIISEELFTYGSDNLLQKSEFFSSGKPVSYSEFTYNENKLLIEEQYFDPQGELLSVSTYEYDDKGRRSKWISGDNGGIPMMYTVYEYKNDKLVQMNYHMPSGELEGYTQLEYDGDVLVLEASYGANSKLEKKSESVLENGRIIKVLHFIGNNLIRTVEHVFDDAGNVIEAKTLNKRGDVIDIVMKDYVVFSVEKTVLQ